MHYLATHWLMFLLIAVGLYITAFISQALRMKRFVSSDGSIGSLFTGMIFTVIIALGGHVSAVLFVIGVVANLLGK